MPQANIDAYIASYPTSRSMSWKSTSKGAAQFPRDKPLPLDLIMRITRFRVRENQKVRLASKE